MGLPSYCVVDPAKEVTALRQKCSKTYQLAPGRFRTIVMPGAMHYHTGTAWEDIDLTPQFVGGKYRPTAAPYQVEIDPAAVSLTYTNAQGGTLTLQLLKVGNKNPNPRVVTKRSNTVFTIELDTDVLLEGRFFPEGVDLYRRILTPTAAHEFTWRVTESLTNPPRCNILAIKGRDNQNGVDRKLVEVTSVKGAETLTATTRRYDVVETITGRVREVDPQTSARSWSTNIRYPLLIDPTVNETIAASEDDGFEKAATWYSNNDYTYCTTTQNPAWRFQTVAVPQGATINTATLGWTQVSATADSGTLYGEDVDDAASWALFSANGPSGMTKTTATATMTIATTGAKTLDVQAIVQEIIDRGAWSSGNDLRLGATGFTAADGANKIEALDFLGGTGQATLDIDYTEAGPGPAGPTLVTMHTPLRW